MFQPEKYIKKFVVSRNIAESRFIDESWSTLTFQAVSIAPLVYLELVLTILKP